MLYIPNAIHHNMLIINPVFLTKYSVANGNNFFFLKFVSAPMIIKMQIAGMSFN